MESAERNRIRCQPGEESRLDKRIMKRSDECNAVRSHLQRGKQIEGRYRKAKLYALRLHVS
jgi:hypothetical protein